MERWGQSVYVKSEAYLELTSEVYGRVSKELKAVELLWGQRLFPEDAVEQEGKSKGYPKKDYLKDIFKEQEEHLIAAQAPRPPLRTPTFVNLLANAGLKARVPVPDGELDGKLERIARALLLLTSASILKIRAMERRRLANERRGAQIPLEEGQELGQAEERQQRRHRREGGRAPTLGRDAARNLELRKGLRTGEAECDAILDLMNVLLDEVAAHFPDPQGPQGSVDWDEMVPVLELQQNPREEGFCICPRCALGDRAKRMVRMMCGHAFCSHCFLESAGEAPPHKLPLCLFRCTESQAFQAVEVGMHVGFQGRFTNPGFWMPPISKVMFDDCLIEGFFTKEQQREVGLWNQRLFEARRRVLELLSRKETNDDAWHIVGQIMEGLRADLAGAEGPGWRRAMDGIALTYVSWVLWIRGRKDEAVEEMGRAVEQMMEAVRESLGEGKQSIGECLGKTRCTLALMHFRRRTGRWWKQAMDLVIQAQLTMETHRNERGRGDTNGYRGVLFYVAGAVMSPHVMSGEAADAALQEAFDAGVPSDLTVEGALQEARDAYKEQLRCYNTPSARVTAYIKKAVRLNVKMVETLIQTAQEGTSPIPPTQPSPNSPTLNAQLVFAAVEAFLIGLGGELVQYVLGEEG